MSLDGVATRSDASEVSRVIATAGVVVFDGDSVLLIEHGEGAGHVTGAWGIPAGAIDPGETARMAAARELLEETGLSVEVGALAEIPVLYQARIARKVGVAQFSLRAFVSHDFGGSLRASDEGIPRWVQLDRVGSLEGLLPNTAEIVDAAASLVRG